MGDPISAVLAVPFVLGWRDRLAALGLLLVRGIPPALAHTPLHAGELATLGLLVAHLLLPPAPYGSWDARGRPDPRGGWRMPAGVLFGLRLLLFLLYCFIGFGIASGALVWGAWIVPGSEFAPALTPALAGFGLLHLLASDPGWIRAESPTATDWLFYDGGCGLCHRAVRFVLAEDLTGTAFRFAPIGAPAFERTIPAAERAGLPDSVIVRTASGRTLTRSASLLHVGHRLGGWWRVLAAVGGLVPRALRDGIYDAIARVRKRLFAPPPAACPIVPAELRRRFDY